MTKLEEMFYRFKRLSNRVSRESAIVQNEGMTLTSEDRLDFSNRMNELGNELNKLREDVLEYY